MSKSHLLSAEVGNLNMNNHLLSINTAGTLLVDNVPTTSGLKNIVNVTAQNYTLTLPESGSTVIANAVGGGNYIILPNPPITGLNYKFICGVSGSTTYIYCGSPNFYGTLFNATSSNVATGAFDVDFMSNSAVGDTIEIVSDGTNYYFQGHGASTSGINNF